MTEKEIKEAKELRASGMTYSEIGTKLGYSQTYISRKISDGKLYSKAYKQKALNNNQEEEIVKKTKEGATRAALAKEYGVSEGLIRLTLKKRNAFIKNKVKNKSKEQLEKENEKYEKYLENFIKKTSIKIQKQICEEYKGGKSAKKISKEYIIHNEVLKRFLIRFGVQVKSYEQAQRLIPESLHKTICDRYSNGETSTEISKSIGFGTGAIIKVLKEKGLEIRGVTVNKNLLSLQKVICDRYKNGESMNIIANDFNLSTSPIRNILNKNKIKIRTSEESCRAIELKYWQAICNSYEQGKGLEPIAKEYGVAVNVIQRILKKNNIEIRTNFYLTQKWDYGLRENIAIELCEKYKSGVPTSVLEKEYGVEATAIFRTLRKNNYEIRSQGNLGDSVQHALNKTGIYKFKRDTSFYIFNLKGYPNHLKPGISVDVSDRGTKRWYKDCLFEKVFPSRESAYFVEQVVLDATINYWDCPDEIQIDYKWGGRDEVRLMELDDLENVFNYYFDIWDEIGTWAFAADYLPKGVITKAERERCNQLRD